MTQTQTNTMMKAITQHRYGTPEVLELAETPVPQPNDDQVLVKVKASSVNAMEWHLSTGTPYLVRPSMGWRRPKKPTVGADVAGIVEAVGANVKAFEVGDEVFGDVFMGAWAEYALGSEKSLGPKPADVSFEQAGAIGVAGLTALQGLVDHGKVTAGEKVLVIGASGGVGTYAIQMAKHYGAHVTAVCSTRNVDQARSLGADRVIDYTQEQWADERGVYDLVFDGAGLSPVRHSKKVLKPEGRYIVISGPKHRFFGPMRRILWAMLSYRFSSKSVKQFTAKVSPEHLDTLAQLLSSGAVKSVIESRYDLADAPKALAYVGEGHARAKNVILVG